MEYDYGKAGSPRTQLMGGYASPRPAYQSRYDRQGSGSPNPQPQNPSFYPRIAQPTGHPMNRAPPPVPNSAPASGSGGIRVVIKPEYRVAPPVQLITPQNAEVPRSLFTFDFELERRILAEAEREAQGWNQGSTDPSSRSNGDADVTLGLADDPVVDKYLAMGLNKEAVVMAVASFGDVQTKVLDFVPSYNLLREMGFPSVAVAGALAMYDNDRERALAHFV